MKYLLFNFNAPETRVRVYKTWANRQGVDLNGVFTSTDFDKDDNSLYFTVTVNSRPFLADRDMFLDASQFLDTPLEEFL